MDQGLDTALPHLKIGNAVLQGEITPLIGSEILLGLIRSTSHPAFPLSSVEDKQLGLRVDRVD